MPDVTTTNTLKLAQRVLDHRAYGVFMSYDEAIEEHDQVMIDTYARIYNELCCLRQELTPEGLAAIGSWTGPSCTEIIPI